MDDSVSLPPRFTGVNSRRQRQSLCGSNARQSGPALQASPFAGRAWHQQVCAQGEGAVSLGVLGRLCGHGAAASVGLASGPPCSLPLPPDRRSCGRRGRPRQPLRSRPSCGCFVLCPTTAGPRGAVPYGMRIDEQHLDQPGLAVLDISAADEDTARVVMEVLQQQWATSGVTPVRRVPGQGGVRVRVYADVRRGPGTADGECGPCRGPEPSV